MYQIAISNPELSIAKVEKVCDNLKASSEVVHASPRVVQLDNIEKIDIDSKLSLERRGSINVEPAGREIENKQSDDNQFLKTPRNLPSPYR